MPGMRILLVAIGALATAACGSGGGETLPSGAITPLVVTPSPGEVSHSCQPSELTAAVGAPINRGGSSGVVATLRNDEAGTCGLDGYPVAATVSGGVLTVVPTSNGGGAVFGNPSAFHVVLHPGQSAYVGLEWKTASPCRPGIVLALLLPGVTQPVTLPGAQTVCGGGITVTPVLDTSP